MTEQTIYYAPNPNHEPAPKPKAWWKKPVVILPVAAFILGSALGLGATPKPVTVTQEVPGPERIVNKEVEKLVEVPVTPAECITALDLAADAIGSLAEVGSLASDGIMAAYTRNGPELEAITGKVKTLNEKITGSTPAIGAATSACRASAK